MRAYLLLRRSTDDHQADSIETQETGARTWCASRGIDVVGVIVASGVSRAEIVKRDDLDEALDLARRKVYDVLVVRDISRLVGDVFRGGAWIESLLETGASIAYYASNREMRLDDPSWKMFTAFEGLNSEAERKTLAGRTRERLQLTAARGHVAGGRCYGYRNVRVFDGPDNSGRQLRTEYAIDAEQSEVVREIYRLYAEGEGYRSIAKILNVRGVPSPRAGKRGTGSWDMSTVIAMLKNERYIGRIVWGRAGSVYRGGTRIETTKPVEECTVVEVPHLRIVPPELEHAVLERLAANVKLYGGRSALKARAPKYLLGGLARCAACGGPIHAHNQKRGRVATKSYGCKYNHTRGSAVCAVRTRRPVETIDAKVIEWIDHNLLSGGIVRRAMAKVRQQLASLHVSGSRDGEQLTAEAVRLRAEISRLVKALANVGDSPEEVIELIAGKKRRVAEVERQLEAATEGPISMAAKIERMEHAALARLADLRSLLSRRGRDVLAALLDGPLRLRAIETPDGQRFEIIGRYALGNLFVSEGVATSTDGVPSGFSAVEVPEIVGDFVITEAA